MAHHAAPGTWIERLFEKLVDGSARASSRRPWYAVIAIVAMRTPFACSWLSLRESTPGHRLAWRCRSPEHAAAESPGVAWQRLRLQRPSRALRGSPTPFAVLRESRRYPRPRGHTVHASPPWVRAEIKPTDSAAADPSCGTNRIGDAPDDRAAAGPRGSVASLHCSRSPQSAGDPPPRWCKFIPLAEPHHPSLTRPARRRAVVNRWTFLSASPFPPSLLQRADQVIQSPRRTGL